MYDLEANLQQWKYRAVKTNKKHLTPTLNHDKNTTVGFFGRAVLLKHIFFSKINKETHWFACVRDVLNLSHLKHSPVPIESLWTACNNQCLWNCGFCRQLCKCIIQRHLSEKALNSTDIMAPILHSFVVKTQTTNVHFIPLIFRCVQIPTHCSPCLQQGSPICAGTLSSLQFTAMQSKSLITFKKRCTFAKNTARIMAELLGLRFRATSTPATNERSVR